MTIEVPVWYARASHAEKVEYAKAAMEFWSSEVAQLVGKGGAKCEGDEIRLG